MKTLVMCTILAEVVGFSGTLATGADPAKKPMRVGTYDSRAVALAYYRKFYRSPEFTARMKTLEEARDAAKAAGDHEKAKKLEAEGKAEQEHSHSQVFGSAPIDDIVAKIKDQLPQIAKQAGVDMIVSKWSITYRSADAEVVDVTEPMAQLFHPDTETLKILRDLTKHQPVSAEELKQHANE
jgi:hypothetical protein